MAELGFTYYNELPVVTPPTISEMVASLTGGQKTAILNGFALKTLAKTVAYKLGIDRNIIITLYRAIDEIEEMSKSLMRGEVEITPAVIDPETGEVITPAVYNTPPSTIVQLKSQLSTLFSEYFTAAQVGAVVDKMIAYSKYDGTGDATFYAAEVIK